MSGRITISMEEARVCVDYLTGYGSVENDNEGSAVGMDIAERMSDVAAHVPQESAEARALSTAVENAGHALSTLIEGDDEVMAALRKLDGGKELVEEIRDVIKTWNETGEAFIQSQRKAVQA